MLKLVVALFFFRLILPVAAQEGRLLLFGALEEITKSAVTGTNACGPYFEFTPEPDGAKGILKMQMRRVGVAELRRVPLVPSDILRVIVDDTRSVPWIVWRSGDAKLSISSWHLDQAPCLWPKDPRRI